MNQTITITPSRRAQLMFVGQRWSILVAKRDLVVAKRSPFKWTASWRRSDSSTAFHRCESKHFRTRREAVAFADTLLADKKEVQS